MRTAQDKLDEYKLAEIEALRKAGLATWDDEAKATDIKRRLLIRKFRKQGCNSA